MGVGAGPSAAAQRRGALGPRARLSPSPAGDSPGSPGKPVAGVDGEMRRAGPCSPRTPQHRSSLGAEHGMEMPGLGGAGAPRPSPPGVPAAQGESGLQPTSLGPLNFGAWQRPQRFLLATPSLAARAGLNVQTSPPAAWAAGAGEAAGTSLPTPPPWGSLPSSPEPRNGWHQSLPAPGAGHRRDFCPIPAHRLLQRWRRDTGRVTLPTAECHQPGAVSRREVFRASCEGSRSPRSLPCRCEETRWDQASWGPKDIAGVCTGPMHQRWDAPGLCTGLSSGVCCSSKLGAVGGRKAQSCCKA